MSPTAAAHSLRVRLHRSPVSYSPRSLATDLGFEYSEEHLSAPEGREDALLVPLKTGGFEIVVDPRPSPLDRLLGDLPAMLFRVAHEAGHSHFFVPGEPPRRRTPWKPEEEDWCDSFAAALLSRQFRAA